MNQYVEEMRQYYKTKMEFGARTEGCVAKIEGVGDVRREELEEWESMTKRRSSERGRPCASTVQSTKRVRTN